MSNFSFWRNVINDKADWTYSSRLFQSCGPAVENEWSPTVTSHEGWTTRLKSGSWWLKSTSCWQIRDRAADWTSTDVLCCEELGKQWPPVICCERRRPMINWASNWLNRKTGQTSIILIQPRQYKGNDQSMVDRRWDKSSNTVQLSNRQQSAEHASACWSQQSVKIQKSRSDGVRSHRWQT